MAKTKAGAGSKAKAGATATKPTPEVFAFKLSLHVDDHFSTIVPDIVGSVQLTNTNPAVARAVGKTATAKGKRPYTLTVLVTGAGSTSIKASGTCVEKVAGKSTKVPFTITIDVKSKLQAAKPNPVEELPPIDATIPVGALLTAQYPDLNVTPPQLIVQSVKVANTNPAAATAVFAPNMLTITGIAPGVADIDVNGRYLKFRTTNAPAPPAGTPVPASVVGMSQSTTVLKGTGARLSIELTEVKKQIDYPKRFHEFFEIHVVDCPDDSDALPRA